MPTLILLNPQVYHAPESVIMNQKVHYFLDLRLSYFCHIKEMSCITADHLQWTIYGKTKSRGKTKSHKKTSANISRLSNPSLGK